jgi:lysophospholipase
MQPASAIFKPLFFHTAPGADAPSPSSVRLRGAAFPADPAVAGRGVCVLLNGQTEFIEKYFEVIDELRGRGFAVATMDWRGQGGSARTLNDDSRKSYVKDFTEYDDDLFAFMEQIVAPMMARLPPARGSAQEGEVPVATFAVQRAEEVINKPIALAHSMGAHNLLRYLMKHPGAFARCVLTAPMIAISFRGNAAWLVHLVTRAETLRGNGGGWVWGMEARDPLVMSFTAQMVTSDQARFERTQTILRAHPELRLAGATWSWLGAALRSMAWLKRQAEKIATPLLVIGAGADRIVLTAQTRAFAARLPDARNVEIAGAGHEMLMERDVFRAQWWAAFDAFTVPEQASPR